jgi:predicted small secreted protein
MRKLLLVLIGVLAFVLAGCTTGTGNGDGQQIDTQDFFPNDEDNYWTYAVEADPADYKEDWTVVGDPGYELADLQLFRIHVEGAHEDTYLDEFFTDDETDSVEVEGYASYDEGDPEWIYMFTDNPLLFLEWQSDGLDVDDEWDAWEISGVPPYVFDLEDAPADTLGFELTGEVVSTDDFDYQNTTLTAYKVVISGDVIFEEDGEETDRFAWQYDYYFVPEFGIVMMQTYTNEWGTLIPEDFYTLEDTNVPIPD